MSVYFKGWGPYFLGWGTAGATAPPPPVIEPPPSLGVGIARRFVVPREMAEAARRLAGDQDAVTTFLAMLTVGIFNDQGDTR